MQFLQVCNSIALTDIHMPVRDLDNVVVGVACTTGPGHAVLALSHPKVLGH